MHRNSRPRCCESERYSFPPITSLLGELAPGQMAYCASKRWFLVGQHVGIFSNNYVPLWRSLILMHVHFPDLIANGACPVHFFVLCPFSAKSPRSCPSFLVRFGCINSPSSSNLRCWNHPSPQVNQLQTAARYTAWCQRAIPHSQLDHPPLLVTHSTDKKVQRGPQIIAFCRSTGIIPHWCLRTTNVDHRINSCGC